MAVTFFSVKLQTTTNCSDCRIIEQSPVTTITFSLELDAWKHHIRLASQTQVHFGRLVEGSKSSSLSHSGIELATPRSQDSETDALDALPTVDVLAITFDALD